MSTLIIPKHEVVDGKKVKLPKEEAVRRMQEVYGSIKENTAPPRKRTLWEKFRKSCSKLWRKNV